MGSKYLFEDKEGIVRDSKYWAKYIGISDEAFRYRVRKWGYEKALALPKNGRIIKTVTPNPATNNKEGKRVPSKNEIECAKFIRSIINFNTPNNVRYFMSECYFDIMDNGINAPILKNIHNILVRYGGIEGAVLAESLDLKDEVILPVEKQGKISNIYVAVDVFLNNNMFKSKVLLSYDEIKYIHKEVCKELDIDYEVSLYKTRRKPYVLARKMTAYLCKGRAKLSQLAEVLIGTNAHWDILYYHKDFVKKLSEDENTLTTYNKLKIKLGL